MDCLFGIVQEGGEKWYEWMAFSGPDGWLGDARVIPSFLLVNYITQWFYIKLAMSITNH